MSIDETSDRASKMTEPRKRLRLVLAPIFALVTLAGVGVAVAATTGQDPIDPTTTLARHSGDPVTYAHATSKARASIDATNAASQVIEGLGDSSPVTGITATPTSNGSAVTVTLGRNDDDTAAEWVSELAVGAFGELTKGDQLTISDEFFNATAIGPNKAGVVTTTGLGVGAVTLGQQFDSPSDEALSARTADVAKQFGLSVTNLRILHPLESAINVTFTVPDGASSEWTIDQLRTALVGDTPDVEGALIELQSPEGKPLLRAASSYRTANGVLWFAPGEDERFGAGHGTLDTAN